MKHLLLSIFLIFVACALSSQQVYDWQWVNNAGGSSYDYASCMACDAEGNSYIAGQFVGSAAFGDTVIESNGDFDVFIAKIDSDGNYVWVTRGGGGSWEYINGIAIDDLGNCYVTGYYAQAAQFGSINLTCNGFDDIFVAKVDSLGNWQWVTTAGGIDRDAGNAISRDQLGDVYIAGSFIGQIAFGDSVITSTGQKDAFVAKLNSAGNWIWAKKIGGENADYAYGVATDYLGNCYATGAFKINGTAGNINLVCRGQEDVFIAKLDPNGSFIWAKTAGGMNVDEGCGIAVDSTYCYVTGRFEVSATFGTTVVQSAGEKDIFVTKLNHNGSFIWTKRAGGTGSDTGTGICVSNAGKLFLVGYAQTFFYFGDTYFSSNGASDIVVTEVDAEGNYLWALDAGGLEVDYGNAICSDASGNIYITGSFKNEADWGDIHIVGYDYYDAFVAKIGLESVDNIDEYYSCVPAISYLANAYPNPVTKGGSSTITAVLPKGETGELSIYNLKGQLVETRLLSSGKMQISFPNQALPAGLYFYKLQTSSRTEVKKLILLK